MELLSPLTIRLRSAGWWILAVLLSAACASPDPGPGDMVPAGTLVPEEILNCRGDRDGVIEASELPLLAGVTARQRLFQDVDVESRGQSGDEGLSWDLDLEGGRIVEVRTEAVDEQWFAPVFPGASYAIAVDPVAAPDEQILGIYRIDDDGVYLLGTASRFSDRPLGGVLLPYETPPQVLRFPVALGDSWEVEARVTAGLVGGVAFTSLDTYRISIDARGAIHTQDVIIRDAMRLSVEVTIQTPALDPFTRLEIVWYRECLGEVARLTAHEGDLGPELSAAARLMTLAF